MKINRRKFKITSSLIRIVPTLLLLIILSNSAVSKNIMHPGQTGFNVEDRLAIINLVNSYADDYDYNNFNEYLKLFTEDIKCTVYLNSDEPLVVQGIQFEEMMRGFRSSATKNNVGPLHFITNLNIKEQTKDTAVVETYVAYIPLDTSNLHLPEETLNNTKITGTARYIFSVTKDIENIWKIKGFVIKYRQSVVEKTLEQ